MPTGRFLGGVLGVMEALENRRNNAQTLQMQQQQLNLRAEENQQRSRDHDLNRQLRQDHLDEREQTRLDKEAGVQGDQQGFMTLADIMAPHPQNGPMGPQMGPGGVPVPPPSPYTDPYANPRLGQALGGMTQQGASNALRILETRQYHGQQGEQRDRAQESLDANRAANVDLRRQSAVDRMTTARTKQEWEEAKFETLQGFQRESLAVRQQNAQTMQALAKVSQMKSLQFTEADYGLAFQNAERAKAVLTDANKMLRAMAASGITPPEEMAAAQAGVQAATKDYEQAVAAQQQIWQKIVKRQSEPTPQVQGDAADEPLIETPEGSDGLVSTPEGRAYGERAAAMQGMGVTPGMLPQSETPDQFRINALMEANPQRENEPDERYAARLRALDKP